MVQVLAKIYKFRKRRQQRFVVAGAIATLLLTAATVPLVPSSAPPVAKPSPTSPSPPEPATPISTIPGDGHPLRSLALSPNGQRIGAITNEQHLKVWNAQGQPVRLPTLQRQSNTTAIAFTPSGQILTGTDRGSVFLWTPQGEPFAQLTLPFPQAITALAADGPAIAAASEDGAVSFWDQQGKPLGQLWTEKEVRAIALAQDGRQLTVQTPETLITYRWNMNRDRWESQSERNLSELEGYREGTAIALNPNGISAIATRDGQILLNRPQELPSDSKSTPQVDPQVELRVQLGDRQVQVYQNEELLGTYPIAVGKAGWETPTGRFRVFAMRKDPAWTHPITREVVPPGENPLGDRWIAFWTDGDHQVGFHGTQDESSVGAPVSHGCLRMRNQDIRKLYELVKLGTIVVVEP
jgi:lipoprotein-anchoring transpeptidase ErfK/SrfK